MEWKEDAVKAGIVAFLGFVGHAILKLLKKNFTPFFSGIKNISDIEGIKNIGEIQGQTFDAIIEIHRSPIYYTDADGGMTYANTAWLELTGFTNVEDAFGMGYMRAISDEDEKDLMLRHDSYVKNPSDMEGEITFIHLKTKVKTLCRYRNKVIRVNGKFIKGIGILEILNK